MSRLESLLEFSNTGKHAPDPAVVLSYPGEMKAYVHKQIPNGMFTAALFRVVIHWQQTKHPSAREGVSKL